MVVLTVTKRISKSEWEGYGAGVGHRRLGNCRAPLSWLSDPALGHDGELHPCESVPSPLFVAWSYRLKKIMAKYGCMTFSASFRRMILIGTTLTGVSQRLLWRVIEATAWRNASWPDRLLGNGLAMCAVFTSMRCGKDG